MRKFRPACRDNFVVLTVVEKSLRWHCECCECLYAWKKVHPAFRREAKLPIPLVRIKTKVEDFYYEIAKRALRQPLSVLATVLV